MRIVNDRNANEHAFELFSHIGGSLMSYPSFILLGKGVFFFSMTVLYKSALRVQRISDHRLAVFSLSERMY